MRHLLRHTLRCLLASSLCSWAFVLALPHLFSGCGDEDSGAGPSSSFRDLGDGTVLETRTGLVWQQQDDETTRIWRQAREYCTELELAGFTDWRLPEREELGTIVDLANFNPAVNLGFFPSTKPEPYWTSTQVEEYAGYSWYVHFGDGSEHYGSRTSVYLARCVH